MSILTHKCTSPSRLYFRSLLLPFLPGSLETASDRSSLRSRMELLWIRSISKSSLLLAKTP